MKPTNHPSQLKQLLCATAILGAASSGHAATWVDSNIDNTWSTAAANWDTGVWVNSATSDAIFNGTGETITATGTPTFRNLTFNGNYNVNGNISLAANGIVNVADTKIATINGILGGAFNLTKTGTGNLTLNANNTFTGETLISDNSGKVTLGELGFLRTTSGITIGTGSTLEIKATSALSSSRDKLFSATNAGALVINGTLSNTGTLENRLNYANSITMNNGTILCNGGEAAWGSFLFSASGTIAANGASNTISGTSNGIGISGGTLTFDTALATDALAVSAKLGATSAVAGAVQKTGLGTVTMSGANTYTGGLTVNGGTLNYTGGGSVTGGGGAVNIASGATLNLSGAGNNQLEATGVLTIAGTLAVTTNSANTLRGTSIVLNGGTMTSSGGNGGQAATYGAFFTGDKNMTVTANGTVNFISGNGDFGIQNGRTLTLATPLLADGLTVSTAFKGVGGTAGALTKTGLGTVTLSGANSYTGATNVNAGTLQAGSNSAFGSGAVNVNDGGTLEVKGHSLSNAIKLVSGGTVKVDSDASGTGSVGTITATGGTFDSGSNASQNFNLNGGSTFNHLSGQGTFTGGMVSIVNSHNPGNSPGTQTFNTGLTYGNGASLTLEISAVDTNYDILNITGGLNIGTGVALTLSLYGADDYSGSFWNSNQTFTLINADTVAGDFLTPTNNLGGAGEGSWSYGWVGNQYKATWTAVPEPSAALLGSIGVLFLLRRRRA